MADQIVQRIAIEGADEVKKSFTDIASSGVAAIGQIKQATDALASTGGTSFGSLLDSIKSISSIAGSIGSALTAPFTSAASASSEAAGAIGKVNESLNGIRSAGSSAAASMNGVAAAAGGAGGSFGEFISSIGSLGASLGALAGAFEVATAGIIAFTVRQAEAALRTQRMATGYGSSIEDLNLLSMTFAKAGLDINEYRLSFNRLETAQAKSGEVQDQNREKVEKYALAVHDAIEKATEYAEKLSDNATKRQNREEDLADRLKDIDRKGYEERVANAEKMSEKLEDIANARRDREASRESSHVKELESYSDKYAASRKKAEESISDFIDQRQIANTKNPQEKADLEFALEKKKIERQQKAELEAEQKKLAREREKEARDEQMAQAKEQRDVARQTKHDAEQEKKEQEKEKREIDRENRKEQREIARDAKTDEREARKEQLRLEKEDDLLNRLLKQAEKAQQAIDGVVGGVSKEKSKSLLELVVDLADKLKKIEDPAEKAKVLLEFMARKGPAAAMVFDIINTKGIDALKKEAEALGYLTGDQTKKLGQVSAAWNILGIAVGNTKDQIALVFSDAAQGAIERLTQFVNYNRSAFVNIATILTNLVAPAFKIVHAALLILLTGAIQAISKFMSALKTLVTPVTAVLNSLIGPLVKWFFGSEISPENLAMVVAIGAITFKLGLLMKAWVALKDSVGLASMAVKFLWGNPMLVLLGAVIAAVALIAEHWDVVKQAADDAAASINRTFGTTITGAGLLKAALISLSAVAVFTLVSAIRTIGASLLTPWGAIVAAVIVALGAIITGIIYLYKNWDEITKKCKEAWASLMQYMPESWGTFLAGVSKGWDIFWAGVSKGWDIVIGYLKRKTTEAADWVYNKFKPILDLLSAVGSALGAMDGQGGGNSSEAPTQDTSNATGGNQGAFASGGLITGRGGPKSDSILARLSNGEFVQSAAAVQRYGVGFMHSLNSLSLPIGNLLSFASGGLVNTSISIPATAGGASHGTKLDLHIGGETFAGLIAPATVARKISEFATTSNARSIGRKPSWVR